jgi:hypothetical protein
MYLEVYVFNSAILTEEQLYDEKTLPDFPPLNILRGKIDDQVPNINWLDAEMGLISTSEYQGQLILGNDKKAIYFRIVGGKDPFKVVMDLCRRNGWTCYTPENELFLDGNLDTVKYWQDYKTYKGIIDNVFYNRNSSEVD